MWFQLWRGWCGLMIGLAAASASAHPHIWIESYYQVDVTAPNIQRVEAVWAFDAFSSNDLLIEFDTNADGRLEKEEKAEAAAALRNLEQYGYFLAMQEDGEALTADSVQILDLWVQEDMLHVRLGIVLPEPVNVQQHTLRLGFGDPENYFAMVIPDAGLIKLTGTLAELCTPTPAAAEAIYMEGWVDLSCDK